MGFQDESESIAAAGGQRKSLSTFGLPIIILAVVIAGGAGWAGQAQIHPFVAKRLVYQVAGREKRDQATGDCLSFRGGIETQFGSLSPARPGREDETSGRSLGQRISDSAIKEYFGVNQKDLGLFCSWAELIAASGMIAVTYESERSAYETGRLIGFLQRMPAACGIDPERIAVFGCSANTLTAQSLMQEPGPKIKGAVLYYPILATPDQKNSDIMAPR